MDMNEDDEMKLFGNDGGHGHVSRNTADFEPISAAKADKARAKARREADRARSRAYKEYAAERPRQSYAEAKSAAKQQKRAASGAGAAKPQKRPGAWKKPVIICACVLAALAIGVTAFAAYVAGTDTIYPNITVGGVDVGGMTLTEAAYELEVSGWTNENETVTVALPMEHTLTVTAAEAGASVTAEQAAQTAYDYCHEGHLFNCLSRYLRSLVSGGSAEVRIEVDEEAVRALVSGAVTDILGDLESSGMELDEDEGVIRVVKGADSVGIDVDELTGLICEALAERRYGALDYSPGEAETEPLDVDSLHDAVFREAQDAGYDPETDEIIPSVNGVDFDKAEARRLWDAAGAGDTVEIPCEITEPEYTTEDYEELLFSVNFGEPVVTSLSGSSANRINNVQLACKAIDGVVLMPGEQFDYNKTLGERTAARGYKPAGAYSGGEVVQEVGGGICQVSSALYYAALLANLQIDTRSCHYFPVGYLPAGLDATVSWGGPEFRFTNNGEWPIKIEASVDTAARTATVTILGTNIDGTYVVMEHAVTGYVYGNSEYPETPTGYRAQTHRCVYDADGNLISRTTEANSEYHYHEEDIAYPSPSPSPTPSAPPEESAEPAEPVEPTEPAGGEEDVPPDGESYYFAR